MALLDQGYRCLLFAAISPRFAGCVSSHGLLSYTQDDNSPYVISPLLSSFPCSYYPAHKVLCYCLVLNPALLLSTSTFRGNLNACTLRWFHVKSNISVRYTFGLHLTYFHVLLGTGGGRFRFCCPGLKGDFRNESKSFDFDSRGLPGHFSIVMMTIELSFSDDWPAKDIGY